MFKKTISTIVVFAFVLWLSGYIIFNVSVISKNSPPAYPANKESFAIIVLTGGKNRVQEGIDLFKDGVAKHLLITGVHQSVDLDTISKQSKKGTNLPECCITLGHMATTTIENATEAKDWINENAITDVLLVTSNYHLPRAVLEFSSVMPNLTIIPYHMQQQDYTFEDYKFWQLTFEEYHKIIYRVATLLLHKVQS